MWINRYRCGYCGEEMSVKTKPGACSSCGKRKYIKKIGRSQVRKQLWEGMRGL